MSEKKHVEESAAAVVVAEKDPRMEILSFAVALPPSIVQGWDEPPIDDDSNSGILGLIGSNQGIVGTIVLLKTSVMIWFGWGQLETKQQDAAVASEKGMEHTRSRSIGAGRYHSYACGLVYLLNVC